jgi:ubiquinone/menaquinone biosynthesis C-methylase UbiE
MTSSSELPDYALVNREQWTRVNAEFTDANANAAWSQEEITWGQTHAREADLGVLGDFAGKDVVELGCGTGYFGARLKRNGAARVVGVDVTPAQLESARRVNEASGLGLEFVEANAEATGLPDASFDLAVSEYGASIWCDPYKWIPEAARLLRPPGELVFLRNSTLRVLCTREEMPSDTETLQRPQRGLHRIEWRNPDEVEFALGHGDWFRLLHETGFEVLDLVELFATEDTPPSTYYAFSREWAERWPLEEIWRARLHRR